MIATEQAGGLDAIGHARRQLRRGARIAVTGGTDAPLSPACMVAQLATGLLSRVADPTAAYLPFDERAAGYVPGEGGAIIEIMERREDAARRGAERVYGEIVGYAATFDPAPGSGRGPTLGRAIRHALDDARIAPGDIDVVFADGCGTPDLDRAEGEALTEVFGPYGVPVTVPKTGTGRMYSGGAALNVATALLAMGDSVVPPTPHVDVLALDCPLDLVRTEPRELPIRNALVCARGVGRLQRGRGAARRGLNPWTDPSPHHGPRGKPVVTRTDPPDEGAIVARADVEKLIEIMRATQGESADT
ncbi:Actinorhodin polyketide putative beta-ketoacyl synthase 2 OS=Streptomyces fumanus OX=67302 GN=GCM10018772_33940 PE=3 SV=1 [Streptomyces fumanus]